MLSLKDRVDLYNLAFPNWPKIQFSNNWIIGYWSIGACYAGPNWYGAYPYGYLKRIRTMFPEFGKEQTLHLFSGSLSPGFESNKSWMEDFPGLTFDINPKLKPDFCGDAQNASALIDRKFDLILADCPYSAKDAEKYGYPMINRKKVMFECAKILNQNGFLIWLDEVLPMYKKIDFKQVGGIGIQRSTNHRIRASFIFQKV